MKKPQLITVLRAWDDDNELAESDDHSDERNELALDGSDGGKASDCDSVAGLPSLTDQVGEEQLGVIICNFVAKTDSSRTAGKWDKEKDERVREAREREWETERGWPCTPRQHLGALHKQGNQ